MTQLGQMQDYLERLTAGEVLPQAVRASVTSDEFGLSPLAVRVVQVSHEHFAMLETLEELLHTPLEPDPLAVPLCNLGVHVATELHTEALAKAFSERLENYQARFATSHALVGVSDALTDLALAQTLTQPYAADDGLPGAYTLPVKRLRDAVTARFDTYPARLYDLSESDTGYQEIGLELSPEGTQLLRELDPATLRLRFVFDSRYLELSSHDQSLFDVELNTLEQRLYFKLRPSEWLRWNEIESVVIMGGSKP